MQIEGHGALIAGGASGLGEATARLLHGRGADVVIADLNEDKGTALADELGARFVRADVTEPEQVQEAVEAAAAVPGGLRISVCCAGIGWAERTASNRGPHQLQPFETVIRVNLIGTFNVLRIASAKMLESEPLDSGERGVCINTASIAAFDGQIGQISYSASKGGIVGMTLPAARDLARGGIRVCTIAPACSTRRCLPACRRSTARRWPRRSRSRRGWDFPTSTRRSPLRSSRTRCSTARRSGWTGRCGWRLSSRAGSPAVVSGGAFSALARKEAANEP